MRRTQQQRREETVGRLLEASIASIIEIGYARTSAAIITKRAGVSVGTLFRHFETMGDFMAATVSEVLRRQLDSFNAFLAEMPADEPTLEAALRILQDLSRVPRNAVVHELVVAARTDEMLKAHLQDVFGAYNAKFLNVARAMPGNEFVSADESRVLATLCMNLLDGAAIIRTVLPASEREEQRIEMLAELIYGALPEEARGLALGGALETTRRPRHRR